MSTQAYVPDSVHLVGSVALDTVEDVFATCGRTLGRRLKRIPDGEPGGRRLWISWQRPCLRANRFFDLDDPAGDNLGRMRLGAGVSARDVYFQELGYYREARASYQDFLAARERGDVSADTRFQVALPMAHAVVRAHFTPDALPIAEAAYEKAMLREAERIAEGIRHEDLCIQWDVCQEMLIWDGSSDAFRWTLPGDGKTEIMKRLCRAAAAVPDGVELGFHLCYGDLDAKHFFDPKDMAPMVEIGNELFRSVRRRIDYVHMPVPIDRDDDAFFRPLENLQRPAETELYLGVVHRANGREGLQRRIEAASKHVRDFGIATECGIARRRSPEMVREILALYAAGAREPHAVQS